MGKLGRNGEVRALVDPGTTKREHQPKVRALVEPNLEVATYAQTSYAGLDRHYSQTKDRDCVGKVVQSVAGKRLT